MPWSQHDVSCVAVDSITASRDTQSYSYRRYWVPTQDDPWCRSHLGAHEVAAFRVARAFPKDDCAWAPRTSSSSATWPVNASTSTCSSTRIQVEPLLLDEPT